MLEEQAPVLVPMEPAVPTALIGEPATVPADFCDADVSVYQFSVGLAAHMATMAAMLEGTYKRPKGWSDDRVIYAGARIVHMYIWGFCRQMKKKPSADLPKRLRPLRRKCIEFTRQRMHPFWERSSVPTDEELDEARIAGNPEVIQWIKQMDSFVGLAKDAVGQQAQLAVLQAASVRANIVAAGEAVQEMKNGHTTH